MIDREFLAAQQAAASFPLLDTSMSQIDLWSRCDRRYYYRHVRGLVPRSVDDKLQWGTLFHVAAQEYYRGLKNNAREDAALHNAKLEIERRTLVENKWHGNTEITLTGAQRETLADTFDYYYKMVASKDEWDEIVAVEDQIFLVVGYGGKPVLRIRSTMDLLARKAGRLALVDHKTTGDVQQNLDFLGLDFQAREYPLAVRSYYQEDPIFCYNMIAREVPPGFGSRSVLTETGRKRNAETLISMSRPERYLRREWLNYSNEQYEALQRNLVQIALALNFNGASGIWPRRTVKMGPMACGTCPYFEICKAELDGRRINDDSPVITVAFTKDPLCEPKPEIAIGLPGGGGFPA